MAWLERQYREQPARFPLLHQASDSRNGLNSDCIKVFPASVS